MHSIPPILSPLVAAAVQYRDAQLAHERAPSPELEEAMRAAGRALCRAAERLPAPKETP